MKKLDFLKQALLDGAHKRRAWITSVFAITKPKVGAVMFPWKLIPEAWGYSYVNQSGELEKIDDGKPGEALFKFMDVVTIDHTWISNVQDPITTTVGNLLFNHFCITAAFGPKFPFAKGQVSVSKLEDYIASRLQDTPEQGKERSTEYIYCDEYIAFQDRLQEFSSLSQLAAYSATRKAIIPPTGIREFKKQILPKYEGKLHDPVEISKLEDELKAFDDAFLKDDPGYGKFIAGKIKNTARKKLFLTMGNEQGFGDSLKASPVLNSLNEGWPTDPVQFTYMMNGLRVASYARGAETVKGGVSAKILLRAANNFKIVDTDCGSLLGMERNVNKDNFEQLVGRYLLAGNKITLVENKEQASNYLGKVLRTRSPQFCKIHGDAICKVCAGERLNANPTGLTIPLTEVSAIILVASLKKMHISGTSTARLNLEASIS